ncbi:MAG: DUF1127 domain-containing protein [Alphaproteobacteria bacterium]
MTDTPFRSSDGTLRLGSRSMTLDLLGEAVGHAVSTLNLWRERSRARQDLARLDERMLADIGLTPSDRNLLVNKPFWRE